MLLGTEAPSMTPACIDSVFGFLPSCDLTPTGKKHVDTCLSEWGSKLNAHMITALHNLVQARMQRNRESAQQSRQRKRMQMDEVEQRCEQFKQHNSQLNQLVGRLTAENMGLKQQLVHICQQTGHPLPAPPPLTMYPYGFGQMGLPQVPAPKVCRLFLPANLTCCCVSSVA